MESTQLSLEDKFAKIIIDLRRIRPFYSAIYEAIPKIEKESVPTMGVDSSHLYYNREFVERLHYKEFKFVILHEIGHIAMMHVARSGNRDATIWNIAADLFVNKILQEEFSAGFSKPETIESSTVEIAMPKGVCFTNTIDTEKDIVEEIYESLYNQLKDQGYFDNNMDDAGKEYEVEYSGSNNEQVTVGGGYGTYSFEPKPFKIKLTKQYVGDLIDNGKDSAQQENDGKQILSEAQTRYEMTSQSRGAGKDPGRFKFYVDEILKSRINWKKLLRKYLISFTSKDTSFASPDKRMYYQRAIYPGQANLVENGLENVKLCVDTSGSMSTEDLLYITGQVFDLTTKFKTNAELICWDTEVESVTKLSDKSTVHTKKGTQMIGGGGTDPRCLWKYFESKECKVKPYVIIIFTDGYFLCDEIDDKLKKKYNKVIWIMTRDYNKDFKPKIGKVAFADFDVH